MSVLLTVDLAYLPDGVDRMRIRYNGDDERIYNHLMGAKIYLLTQINRSLKKIGRKNGGSAA